MTFGCVLIFTINFMIKIVTQMTEKNIDIIQKILEKAKFLIFSEISCKILSTNLSVQ